MAGRRTNLALLWCTVLAVVTGVAAFTVGTSTGAWVIVLHGVLALAIVSLAPWKAPIASRGLDRRRSGRTTSLFLTVSVLGAVGTGLVLVTGTASALGPFTIMQLHVGLGAAALLLTLAHTRQRPVPHRPTDLERRNLVRSGGLLASAAVLWLFVEASMDLTGLKGGERRFTGSHEVRDPAAVPATQWLNDRVQHIDARTHLVRVAAQDYSVAELDRSDRLTATLDCTGGWYTTQEWSGTSLDRLLDVRTGQSLVVRSTTGYWRRFPIEQAPSLLLATQLAGTPLPAGNGGPVRLVAPGRRGYWWVKWVESVDVDDRPPWWQPPLPLA